MTVVTITGTALADATVTVAGQAVPLLSDTFTSITFAMPAFAGEGAKAVTVSTPSTSDPVPAGSVSYSLASLSTGIPTVTGSAKLGSTVTATPGAWTAGTVFGYQWMGNGNPIPGATSASYSITADVAGLWLTVRVTGTNLGYRPGSSESAPVKVVPGTLSHAKPKILGKAKVGKVLRVKAGAWTPGTTLRYQWFANGKKVKKATKAKYKIAKKYAGKKLVVKVTGSKAGYQTVTVASRPTTKVKR